MADYATTVKNGNKSYHISISGKDVYFSSTKKTGGIGLKGIKCINNQLRNTANKAVSEFELAQAISRSL